MIRVGIIGGTGIVAGELIRLLMHHPKVKIDFVYSHSKAGQSISASHPDLEGFYDEAFSDKVNKDVDLLFLSLGHGNSQKFLEKYRFPAHTRIIDLSNDFRLAEKSVYRNMNFVYGLPELYYQEIKNAHYIANPGCFATAIQLAFLPLATHQLLQDELHIHALTGATGAGKSLSETTHFIWRSNNLSVYKAFRHQHLAEIKQSLKFLQTGFNHPVNFVPMRGDFARGIFVSAYLRTEATEAEIKKMYADYYQDHLFTRVSDKEIYLKQVINTNYCLLNVSKYDDKIHITSVIDNLLKGAAGQAVHNMNLMFDFEETEGLKLKASAY